MPRASFCGTDADVPSRPDAPGEAAVLEEVVGIHELCARPNGCAFCVAELARYVVAQAL